MTDKERVVAMQISLPVEIHQKLTASAHKDLRSIQKQAIYFISQGVNKK